MVRPFTLRDLPLVRSLSEQGVSLHAESALADSLHPLRGALLSMVVGGDFPTYVWKSEDRLAKGFIQLTLEMARNHAHIRYLSPAVIDAREVTETATAVAGNGDIINSNIWLSLLDQAMVEVGQYGIHSLVAEVDESGAALPVLRHAGFAVYTRQDIWVIEQAQPTPLPITKALVPRQAEDDWDIQLLYANLVPRLVQLVEPMPKLSDGEAWILRDEQGELDAFVHLHRGAMATWLRFFIHPNAEEEAQDIVTAALQVTPPREDHPVYCCVRRYEGWSLAALENNGFRVWGSQAVMVKHTVHKVRQPLQKHAAVLEGQGVPVSSPFVQNYQDHGEDEKISW